MAYASKNPKFTSVITGALTPVSNALTVTNSATFGLTLDSTSGNPRLNFAQNGSTKWQTEGTSSTFILAKDGSSTCVSLSYSNQATTLGHSTNTTSNHLLQSANTNASTGAVMCYSTAAADASVPAIWAWKTSNDNSTSQVFVRFAHNAGATNHGGIRGDGGTTPQFFAASDRRIKQDVAPLNGSLARLLALKPSTFRLKWNPTGPVCTGFIAQEFAEVFPEAVTRPDDGLGDTVDSEHTWTMSEGGLVVHLVKAIQELKAEFDAYKASHP